MHYNITVCIVDLSGPRDELLCYCFALLLFCAAGKLMLIKAKAMFCCVSDYGNVKVVGLQSYRQPLACLGFVFSDVWIYNMGVAYRTCSL